VSLGIFYIWSFKKQCIMNYEHACALEKKCKISNYKNNINVTITVRIMQDRSWWIILIEDDQSSYGFETFWGELNPFNNFSIHLFSIYGSMSTKEVCTPLCNNLSVSPFQRKVKRPNQLKTNACQMCMETSEVMCEISNHAWMSSLVQTEVCRRLV